MIRLLLRLLLPVEKSIVTTVVNYVRLTITMKDWAIQYINENSLRRDNYVIITNVTTTQ